MAAVTAAGQTASDCEAVDSLLGQVVAVIQSGVVEMYYRLP